MGSTKSRVFRILFVHPLKPIETDWNLYSRQFHNVSHTSQQNLIGLRASDIQQVRELSDTQPVWSFNAEVAEPPNLADIK